MWLMTVISGRHCHFFQRSESNPRQRLKEQFRGRESKPLHPSDFGDSPKGSLEPASRQNRFGRIRVIENLLSGMRELGLVTIFWDVNFCNVHKVFASDGKLLDDSYIRRIDKFLKELIWMAKTLRHGREQIALN